MKRLFALIAVFTILPYFIYSQGVGINESSPKSMLDVEGNMAVGSSYSGTTAAPANGLIVEGKVGIGTSAPGSYELNVSGYQFISQGAYFDCATCGSTSTLFGTANWGDLTIQGRVLSGSSNIHLSPPAGLKVIINDSYRAAGGAGSGFAGLSVEGETWLATGSGNVGIGNVAPAQKLDVTGNIRLTGGVRLPTGSTGLTVIEDSGASGAIKVGGLHLGGSYSGSDPVDGEIKTNGTDIIFQPNGIEEMRIVRTSGNVGIGTSGPTTLLDVNGTVRFRNGAVANYVLQSDASGNASWVDPNGLSGLITGVTAGDGLNGGGTTGTVTVNLGGSLTTTRTITCGTNNLNVNLNSTGDFHIQDNGSSFLYAGDNGLIGIHNTAPAHLLSIGNGSTAGDLTALYVKNTNGTNAAESVSIGLGRSNTHIQGKITASNFADGGFQHGYMSFGTRFNEAISERMKLDWLGNVLIGGIATPVTSAQGTIHLLNGVAPTANLTNGVILYAIDFNDNPPLNGASSELYVRDEDGNATNLSPHHFEQVPQSEEMAWSYYSENDQLGKEINVDMLRTVRVIEELSGEKLVHISDIGDNSYQKDQKYSRTKESLVAEVEMQGKLIEELQQELKDLRKKVNRKIK